MTSLVALALAFAIGVIAGLRSLTAPALVCWAAHLNWINLHNSSLSFLGSPIAVGIFTVLAFVELVTDKLPKTPSRLAPPGLIARLVTGGVSGAALAIAASQSVAVGAVLGAIGGIAGAYAGYQARTGTARALKLPDLVVAIAEDLIAIGGGLFIVSRF